MTVIKKQRKSLIFIKRSQKINDFQKKQRKLMIFLTKALNICPNNSSPNGQGRVKYEDPKRKTSFRRCFYHLGM